MGSLTDRKCVQGQRVSGILVKRNFTYHIMTPSDLSSECVCVLVQITQMCSGAVVFLSVCRLFRLH